MDLFLTFLQQGFTHIIDLNGADHILFLFAICAIYTVKDQKKILWIVTSFTLAHSITLALSVLDIITVKPAYIEFLIAFTIAFTCIENLFINKLHNHRVLLSGLFGLVHGMGFSFQLKGLFMSMQFSFFQTLLPFNIGLEIGQLLIITTIIFIIYLLNKLGMSKKAVMWIISLPVLVQALYWMWQRWVF